MPEQDKNSYGPPIIKRLVWHYRVLNNCIFPLSELLYLTFTIVYILRSHNTPHSVVSLNYAIVRVFITIWSWFCNFFNLPDLFIFVFTFHGKEDYSSFSSLLPSERNFDTPKINNTWICLLLYVFLSQITSSAALRKKYTIKLIMHTRYFGLMMSSVPIQNANFTISTEKMGKEIVHKMSSSTKCPPWCLPVRRKET